jgi:hypothetical protein
MVFWVYGQLCVFEGGNEVATLGDYPYFDQRLQQLLPWLLGFHCPKVDG